MKTVEGAHGFIGKEHPVPGDGIADWRITKVCRPSVLRERVVIFIFSVGFCNMSSAIRMYLYNFHCLAVQGKKGSDCELDHFPRFVTIEKIQWHPRVRHAAAERDEVVGDRHGAEVPAALGERVQGCPRAREGE